MSKVRIDIGDFNLAVSDDLTPPIFAGIDGDKSYPDGTSIAEVMLIQNNGTRHIPSRPWRDISIEFIRKNLNSGLIYSKPDVVGRFMVASMRQTIDSNISPEVTEKTRLRKKRKDISLRDTSKARNSIWWKEIK